MQYTFHELDQTVNNVAGHLQSLGFGQGMNLAICANNCLEILIMELAALKLGGMITLINSWLKPGEKLVQID